MSQSPTQDFIVNSGLTVLGTRAVTSSTDNTGTLQVNGGAAIAKNLIVGLDAEIGGELIVRGSLPFLSITTGTFTNLTVTGFSTLGISTATQLDVAARLLVGGLSQLNNATLSNQTNSTSSTTGALTVAGGVGIEKDLVVAGRAFIGGFEVLTTATLLSSTLEAVTQQGSSTTVAISILNTNSAISTTTGALTVVGGIGVGGKIIAGSDIVTNAIFHSAYYPNFQSGLSGVLVTGTNIVNLISGTTANWVPGMVLMPSYNDPTKLGRFNLSIRSTEIKEIVSATQFTVYFNHTAGGELDFEHGHGYFGAGGTLYGEKGGVKYGTYAGDTAFISARAGNVILQPGADYYTGDPSEYIAQGTGVELVSTNIVFTPSTAYFNMGYAVIDGDISNPGDVYFNMNGDGRVVVNSTRTATSGGAAALQVIGGVFVGDNLRVTNGVRVGGITTITNVASAISTTTGALQVRGGVGIGGALYVNELYITTSSYVDNSLLITTATIGVFAATSITAGTDTVVSTSTGAILIWNTSTLQSITDRGSQTSNAIAISNSTTSTSSVTGALTVDGGVGINQDLYVGGTIYGRLVGSGSITTATNLAGGTAGQVPYQTEDGVTNFYGPGTAGNVLVSNGAAAPTYNNTLTLTSTLSNTTTVAGNALQVAGGVGIEGSLFVSGPAYFTNNVVFSGTSTSVLSTTTVYTDNYIELHFPSGPGAGEDGVWAVDDGKDIGHIYHHYKDATGDEHGALIWHNASDELRWYMGGVDLNTATQVWDVSTATFGVFRTGSVLLEHTTEATSTSTGTLVVVGGVGIGRNLHVGGTVNATSATFSGTLGVTGTSVLRVVNATSATFSGTLGVTGTSVLAGLQASNIVASGTLGVTGTSILAGLTTVTNITSATSTSTGALQVRGGVGIGGALYVQQTSFINGSQVLTAATIGNFGVGTITAGTDTVVSTSTGPVLIWNTSTLQSITNRGNATTNQIAITNATIATSTNTGALQVIGGVGIGGNLYVGGISVLAGVQSTNIVASGTLGVTGTSILAGVQATNIVASGTLGVTGTSTLGVLNATSATFSGTLGVTGTSVLNGLRASNIVASGTLGVTGTSILGVVNATSITVSSTLGVTGTSVLNGLQATNIVASGTLGVTGTSTLGVLNATSATFSGTLGVTGTSVFAGLTAITNATSATSTNTGALQVRGGVGIGGALYVQETSYVNGSQILTVATIANFGVNAITAGTDTVVSTSTGAVLIWNTSTLQSVTNRGAVTTNAVSITNTTSSISTTTGALQVRGGVGVGDSIYVGNRVGFVNTSNVSRVYQVYNAATDSLDTVFG